MGLSEASLADRELLIVCSDILRRWCITLGFKFSPNAQGMHNWCGSHQKVDQCKLQGSRKYVFLMLNVATCILCDSTATVQQTCLCEMGECCIFINEYTCLRPEALILMWELNHQHSYLQSMHHVELCMHYQCKQFILFFLLNLTSIHFLVCISWVYDVYPISSNETGVTYNTGWRSG